MRLVVVALVDPLLSNIRLLQTKNGLVLVQFKTQEQRIAEKYKGYKKTFEADLENLISSEYNIIIKELPLTTSECRAEGYID